MKEEHVPVALASAAVNGVLQDSADFTVTPLLVMLVVFLLLLLACVFL